MGQNESELQRECTGSRDRRRALKKEGKRKKGNQIAKNRWHVSWYQPQKPVCSPAPRSTTLAATAPEGSAFCFCFLWQRNASVLIFKSLFRDRFKQHRDYFSFSATSVIPFFKKILTDYREFQSLGEKLLVSLVVHWGCRPCSCNHEKSLQTLIHWELNVKCCSDAWCTYSHWQRRLSAFVTSRWCVSLAFANLSAYASLLPLEFTTVKVATFLPSSGVCRSTNYLQG